jgi:hypothetical protein
VHFKTQFIFLGKKLHLHGCLLKVTGSDIEYYSQTGCFVPTSFATLNQSCSELYLFIWNDNMREKREATPLHANASMLTRTDS